MAFFLNGNFIECIRHTIIKQIMIKKCHLNGNLMRENIVD